MKKKKQLNFLLKTEGAVPEISGAEFKLSAQQCLSPLGPPPQLAFSSLPHLLSYPSLISSSSTLLWLAVRGPTVSFELLHRHPAMIKL